MHSATPARPASPRSRRSVAQRYLPVVPDGVVVVVVVEEGVVVVVVVDGLVPLLPEVSEPDVEPEVPVDEVPQAGVVSELEVPEVLPLEPDELSGAVTPEPLVPVASDEPVPELPGVGRSVLELPEDEVPDVPPEVALLLSAPDEPVLLVPVVPLVVSEVLLPYPGDEGVDVLELPVPEPESVVDPDMLPPDVPLVPLSVVVPELPEPVLKSDAPLLLVPEVELPLVAGVSVVALAPELPEVSEVLLSGMADELDGDAPCSIVGVVVVLVCPKAADAVPSKENKMARGNFFMLTPSVRVEGCLETAKGVF